ncbi:carbohydrate-binding module family 48 protein [Moniliophthora roreri MCA 2997]|uniref:Carbohydrate-binding module family 48 protein n=1 Tax=Moniliophthora roreri (strain MCA 2997) TaxID=1381753 RepID=V2XJ89_MONRO|nr:carbohydrate-binding module family 48 protein [Moniliophthora roreri MCA 2997]
MADLHQVVFEWPHGGANTVIVTGSFDQWSSSTRLTKQGSTFKATVSVPWNQKIVYKFIVDGQWLVNDREPTEWDNAGNLNNTYHSPEKLQEPVVPPAEMTAPALNGTAKEDSDPAKESSTAADLAKTILAADGTKSSVEYVATGVGAAIQSVIGVDPINANKIPVQTPKAEAEVSVPDEVPVTLAPKVPVEILPVNSEENKPTPLIIDSPTPVLNGSVTSEPPVSVPKKAAAEVSETPVANGNAKEESPVTVVAVTSSEKTAIDAPKPPVTNGTTPVAPASEASSADAKATVSVQSPTAPEEKQANTEKSVSTSPSADKSTKTEEAAASPPTPTKAETNGRAATPVNGKAASSRSSAPGSRASSPAPSTPKKGKHQRFPSLRSPKSPATADESPDSDDSPKSSRFKSISSTRSIKKSLAGLRRVSLKGIFGHKDKDGEEKEK